MVSVFAKAAMTKVMTAMAMATESELLLLLLLLLRLRSMSVSKRGSCGVRVISEAFA